MKAHTSIISVLLLLSTIFMACNKKKPEANFTADNINPDIGQTVSFTDLSSESPTSWVWVIDPSLIDYQEGTSAVSQNPKIKFREKGLYKVTLTASNNEGSDTKSVPDYINVKD